MWYCNIFKAIIDIMVENNNSYTVDFSKILFDIPALIIDPKDKNKEIYHQFHEFIQNKQQDSFEGCDQFFDVIKEMIPNIYELFTISLIDHNIIVIR